MKRLAAILVAVSLSLTLVAESHAGPTAAAPKVHANTPPDKPCRFDNRLDVEIVNGVWFECSCEALMVGTVCDWYEITSPAHDPHAAPKKHNRAKHHPAARLVVKPVLA